MYMAMTEHVRVDFYRQSQNLAMTHHSHLQSKKKKSKKKDLSPKSIHKCGKGSRMHLIMGITPTGLKAKTLTSNNNLADTERDIVSLLILILFPQLLGGWRGDLTMLVGLENVWALLAVILLWGLSQDMQ